MDIDTEDTPSFPRPGDDPWARDPDSRLIACVNFTHDAPWLGYAEGYRRLATIGIEHIEATGRGNDFLVYPIVFNYRHYIELSIKMIIIQARELRDEAAVAPRGHQIDRLWECAEKLVCQDEHGNEIVDPDTLSAVRDCLTKFANIDATAQEFRYPVKNDGTPAIPPEVQSIDLANLRVVMERLDTFLDAVKMDLSVRLDHANEMRSYYQQY